MAVVSIKCMYRSFIATVRFVAALTLITGALYAQEVYKSAATTVLKARLIESHYIISAIDFDNMGGIACADGAVVRLFDKSAVDAFLKGSGRNNEDGRVLGDEKNINDSGACVARLKISDNTRWLLIQTRGREAYLLNIMGGEKIPIIVPGGESVLSILYHKSSYEFLFTTGDGNIYQNIQLLMQRDAIVKKKYTFKKKILSMDKSLLGDQMLVATSDNFINLLDTRSWTLLDRHKVESESIGTWSSRGALYTGSDYQKRAMILLDDGQHYLIQTSDKTAALYTSGHHRAIKKFSTKKVITAVAASHSCRYVCCATSDGAIVIFNAASKKRNKVIARATLKGGAVSKTRLKNLVSSECRRDRASTLVFSKDDKTLAVGTMAGYLYLWDVGLDNASTVGQ